MGYIALGTESIGQRLLKFAGSQLDIGWAWLCAKGIYNSYERMTTLECFFTGKHGQTTALPFEHWPPL